MRKLLISCLLFFGGFISIHSQVYTGAAYYPEHTDKEQVEKDAHLMEEAHFNIARMGDFAWHSMEPKDGVFTLEWLDYYVPLLPPYPNGCTMHTPTL